MATTPPRGRRRSSDPVAIPRWIVITAFALIIVLVGAGGFLLGALLADDMLPATAPACTPGRVVLGEFVAVDLAQKSSS